MGGGREDSGKEKKDYIRKRKEDVDRRGRQKANSVILNLHHDSFRVFFEVFSLFLDLSVCSWRLV